MNLESKACYIPIPIEGSSIREDWLKGRRSLREPGKQAAREVIRCKHSSSDRRPKKLFNGERAMPFTSADRV
ncbi:MAG: hypothetical protein ACREFR_08985 [Limisphaerales bacterium]